MFCQSHGFSENKLVVSLLCYNFRFSGRGGSFVLTGSLSRCVYWVEFELGYWGQSWLVHEGHWMDGVKIPKIGKKFVKSRSTLYKTLCRVVWIIHIAIHMYSRNQLSLSIIVSSLQYGTSGMLCPTTTIHASSCSPSKSVGSAFWSVMVILIYKVIYCSNHYRSLTFIDYCFSNYTPPKDVLPSDCLREYWIELVARDLLYIRFALSWRYNGSDGVSNH